MNLAGKHYILKALIAAAFFIFAYYLVYIFAIHPSNTLGACILLPDIQADWSVLSELEDQTSLSIENINGDIRLSSWEGDTLNIKVTKRVAGLARKSYLKDIADRINIGLDKTPGKITITAEDISGLKSFVGYSVDIDVRLPGSFSSVHASTGRGNIAYNSIEGTKEVFITIKEGNVSISNTSSGSFEIKCDKGRIAIDEAKGDVSIVKKRGSVDLQGINGNISIKSEASAVDIKNAAGRIDADMSSGSIRAESVKLSAPSSFYISSGSIDIKASSFDANGDYKLSTSSGSIKLLIPSGTGFALRARTNNGRVTSNYSIAEGYNKPTRNEMSGFVNEGGPEIDAFVNWGNISVDKY